MDAFNRLAVVFAVLLLYQGFLSVHALSVSESIKMNLRHFSRTRNNYKDPAFVQTTRDFISLAFKGAGLETWNETFTSNDPQFPGINIIGQLPGRYTGTRDDKIVLIGAHYDSVQSTPGVDDNGSGMTALLQALSLFVNPDKQNCSRDYTLMFVAFDLEEPQPFGPGCTNQSDYTTCPCGKGDYPINYDCGSYYFVQNFSRHLNSSGAQLSGAFILDCVMNFNNTPNSQNLPPGTDMLFPNIVAQISSNQNRGDFITLIGRQANDGNLMTTVDKNFNNTDKFKLVSIGLPFSGRPSDALPTPNLKAISSFFESDHFRFWQSKPSLNAIHITDSSYYRSHMIQCYHDSCDDLAHVTDDMITFLGKTVDSLVKSAEELTREKCEVKDKSSRPRLDAVSMLIGVFVVTWLSFPRQFL